MTAGRVAIVTGAARGIGAATTLTLAAAGWSVLAVDLAADDPSVPYSLAAASDLESLVQQGNATAGEVVAYVADVRDRAALAAAVAAAEVQWGGLDAAIGCAAVIAGGMPGWELPVEQEQAILDVDLGGVLNLARAAVPALLRRPEPRSGRFIAVASAAATRGLPMLAAYCAAKAGVAGFVRSLGSELANTGVTVNAVSPGSTDTAMLGQTARLYDLDTTDVFATHQPVGRLLEPAEIAAVIAFLAGQSTGAITGAVIPVDGGLSL